MSTHLETLTENLPCSKCGSPLFAGERVATNPRNGEHYGFLCHKTRQIKANLMRKQAGYANTPRRTESRHVPEPITGETSCAFCGRQLDRMVLSVVQVMGGNHLICPSCKASNKHVNPDRIIYGPTRSQPTLSR